VTILTGHTGPVDVVAWSPDGTRFATSSGQGNSPDYSVHLWRADGTLLATWQHPDIVRALAWSPDGRVLASGSAEATVRLADPDGNLISARDVADGPLLSLA
jgi:WD40 repeat protein